MNFTTFHAGFGRWIEVRAFPTPDGVSVFYKDISDKIKTEEALRASEARFRLALRNAPVSVAAQDRELRFIWAFNQRSAKPEQIIGQTVDGFGWSRSRGRVRCFASRYPAPNQARRYESRSSANPDATCRTRAICPADCFAPTHALQDNSPTENVVAMYETVRECGR